MNELIELAVQICPLVLIDIIYVRVVRFNFLLDTLAQDFVTELAARNGNRFKAAKINNQVIIELI